MSWSMLITWRRGIRSAVSRGAHGCGRGPHTGNAQPHKRFWCLPPPRDPSLTHAPSLFFLVPVLVSAMRQASQFYPPDLLRPPTHIDPAIFASVAQCKGKATQALRGTQYWDDSTNPDGGTLRDADGTLLTDPTVIDEEKGLKATAEAEDAAAEESAGSLRGRGVRIDFLLALTFELDLWEWETKEVCALRAQCRALVVANTAPVCTRPSSLAPSSRPAPIRGSFSSRPPTLFLCHGPSLTPILVLAIVGE